MAAAAAAWALLHALLVVPRLPEPTEPPLAGEAPKLPYASLVTPRNVAWLVVLVFLVAQVVWLIPVGQWPMWVVYLGGIGTLVGIDLLTTYLPKRLHYLVAAELCLATIPWFIATGWASLVAALLGAAAAGGLFWLVWRFSSAFGFGDVRLATLVGFVAGLGGLTSWLYALAIGTFCGALFGIIATIARRKTGAGAFPYGPALWLGPILATTLTQLAG